MKGFGFLDNLVEGGFFDVDIIVDVRMVESLVLWDIGCICSFFVVLLDVIGVNDDGGKDVFWCFFLCLIFVICVVRFCMFWLLLLLCW